MFATRMWLSVVSSASERHAYRELLVTPAGTQASQHSPFRSGDNDITVRHQLTVRVSDKKESHNKGVRLTQTPFSRHLVMKFMSHCKGHCNSSEATLDLSSYHTMRWSMP